MSRLVRVLDMLDLLREGERGERIANNVNKSVLLVLLSSTRLVCSGIQAYLAGDVQTVSQVLIALMVG